MTVSKKDGVDLSFISGSGKFFALMGKQLHAGAYIHTTDIRAIEFYRFTVATGQYNE